MFAFTKTPRGGSGVLRLCALLGLATASFACGEPVATLKAVAPTRGDLTVDGKPGSGLLVVFHPTDDPVANALDPRCVVGLDGTFVVSTHNAGDGAPPGSYRVTIHDPAAPSISAEEGGPAAATPARSRVPSRYTDPARSGLVATVRADSPNIFRFQITR